MRSGSDEWGYAFSDCFAWGATHNIIVEDDMRTLFCAVLTGCMIVFAAQAGVAGVKTYECVDVQSENVPQMDLERVRASVVVPDAHMLSQNDLIDTAKAAAHKLCDKSKQQVIVVKVYPSKDYALFFPQLLDMTYSPELIGWNGKPSARWVAYIADEMPSEEDMFRIRTWMLEQTKNKQSLLDRKKDIAKKMKIPVDDVYFPIFNLVPCLMENNG